MSNNEDDLVVSVLNGAVETRVAARPPDDRAFDFDVKLDLVAGGAFFAEKPPRHFHVQTEYLEAVEGRLVLELDGRERVLTSADGPQTIRPYVHHRTFPLLLPEQEEGLRCVRFRLSAEKTSDPFELNTLMFENWYRYQDEVVSRGGRISLIQVFSTFDAGGTYMTLPWWVPFRCTVAQVLGIVVGRWIGGLLGYQPYYRRWSTDWELACDKMETSFFQRRFADRTKTA
ncbi:hypothetical protein PG989_004453 [Apiospora arundinis]